MFAQRRKEVREEPSGLLGQTGPQPREGKGTTLKKKHLESVQELTRRSVALREGG